MWMYKSSTKYYMYFIHFMSPNGTVVQKALMPYSSRVHYLILSLGNCLCGVLDVLLMSIWVTFMFFVFSKLPNIPVYLIVNCP